MWRKSITFSLFLSMAANIPPINKHFIQWPHHWIMSKIFCLFLSTWRILGFLKWVTRSICFWCRPMLPTNKDLHLGFPADEERCLAKCFSDMNQQVIWHQYCYLLTSFTFAFRKQDTIPFSTLHCKPTIWKARFYFSQFSFSHNVEENCQLLLLLSSPATGQMFGDAKPEMKQQQ